MPRFVDTSQFSRSINENQSFTEIRMSLQKAYELAGVSEPLALNRKYEEIEQPLFKDGTWDYSDPTQLHNQIKAEIEATDLSLLREDECEWCQEILWFWYHHAISAAARKNDKVAAQAFAEKALSLQDEHHPNQITRLLYLLVHDRYEEAKEWAKTVDNDADTAASCILWYEQGEYFGPPQ